MANLISSIFNDFHLRDFQYSTQINRWFLKPIGIWPMLTESTRTEKLVVKLLILTCHLLIILTVAPCVLYILFEDTSLKVRMKAIGPMSHWLMGELNYCCLLMRSRNIEHCIIHVEHDWQTVEKVSDREIMLKSAKFGRFIACIAALCMHSGVLSYNAITGFQKIVFYIGNDSYSMYRLPCPFYTNLLDVRFSPMNEIMFVLQFLSGFIVTSITVGACGLAAVLAMHACGQLSVVMSKLDNLVDTKEEKEEQKVARQKLGSIVEHHLRTLSFLCYIEKVMNMICLVELVGCTMNMCLIKYYLLTEKSKKVLATYVIVYVSMIFNIFIFCYIGEIITEQCKEVGEKVYMTEWYRLPHKTARSLVMIISRSNVVIQITAGKFIQISIVTFGAVFKTSFAYLNVIRTMAM
ncbi:PREDICTED: odorant receptor 4-like [Eufriesea mexicana]|uniref:odorant receptor 4-like n=1 Tax=Eufriesea mexicana TaxID=516756 RepID=UPI00083BF046|nr:PREDICTED: odorant receptor 4-like [Eufriesea mexicana]